MKSLKGTKTAENLLKSYSREMQVGTRYSFFATIAKEQNYIEISKIFTEVATEELAHAKRFYDFLVINHQNEKITIDTEYNIALYNDTKENLKSAILSENDVWRDLYPKFAKIAMEEGFNGIAYIFDLFAKAEKLHEEKFIKLYNDLRNGRLFKKDEKVNWICINCGIIHNGEEPPLKCPGCLYEKGYFKVYE